MDSSLPTGWPPVVVAAVFAIPATQASDGTPDTGNRFPAAGAYYEYFVYLTPGEPPDVAYAEQSCSGSLISPKVFMTAAHCTAYNYTTISASLGTTTRPGSRSIWSRPATTSVASWRNKACHTPNS